VTQPQWEPNHGKSPEEACHCSLRGWGIGFHNLLKQGPSSLLMFKWSAISSWITWSTYLDVVRGYCCALEAMLKICCVIPWLTNPCNQNWCTCCFLRPWFQWNDQTVQWWPDHTQRQCYTCLASSYTRHSIQEHWNSLYKIHTHAHKRKPSSWRQQRFQFHPSLNSKDGLCISFGALVLILTPSPRKRKKKNTSGTDTTIVALGHYVNRVYSTTVWYKIKQVAPSLKLFLD